METRGTCWSERERKGEKLWKREEEEEEEGEQGVMHVGHGPGSAAEVQSGMSRLLPWYLKISERSILKASSYLLGSLRSSS